MKLSDAFEKKVENPELELSCKVYNINFGKNEKLLEECKILKDYMTFVDYVRKYHKEQENGDLKEAINKAIDRCINKGILVEFLQENRSEVIKVTQMDYTYERRLKIVERERDNARREGREEGRQEGLKDGQTQGAYKLLISLVDGNVLSISEAAKQVGLLEEEFKEKMDEFIMNGILE